MEKISVLGAGSWGTALAMVLSDNGHSVTLWGNNANQINEINDDHTNKKYLPEIELPQSLKATVNLNEAINGAKYILLVVPTKAIREVCQKLNNELTEEVTIIHASKGIEPDTSKRVSEMISEEINPKLLKSVVVLSGPSHAEEVALRHPTTVTSASENMDEAEYVQDLFSNGYFRVYTNEDVIGVEIGGALKNIIALAAGITDGLGYGDNAKAALMTRGLAEIIRLGKTMGANTQTFAGLTGMGDLIVTCTSVHSRNWRAGNLLGKGQSLEEVLDNMGMIVEGVRTTKAAYQLAKQANVEMPIVNELYAVLFENKNPKLAVDALMSRVKRHEGESTLNFISDLTE
ncbi:MULTISPECIES: NAD(P)H-dependent glycerol-3-phosphate dehydrogenase [unclassified Bacillus (in: firmicutes)]|uniref:NAD(P)H-dependent glycerol-3-phosphate dehydrogenase n=1 Tax=unclassified Bacillus (in: firmicutes) TaxID=185979 RepID=UPI000BEFF762|nr:MULTISPECIES: NAD(P)H-dependent glycerol-3-phosphate dehydrogenase [unclassified Bacillus (in: firmicutes)]PEJ53759.1 NAD(P)H-dependent glycerol-3-phosphate dehydrogenase [Bacillus sp. AFS002410]PEL11666.1 NAD(P)H-dependent glycerol-3-phosphate dehydrogenase [Bacillus sp. AFS017336]